MFIRLSSRRLLAGAGGPRPRRIHTFTILDGKAVSRAIQCEIREEVRRLEQTYGRRPGLAALLVGDKLESRRYVERKAELADKLGFHSVVKRLPQSAGEDEVLAAIDECNQDARLHGILVQLPLPPHLRRDVVLNRIHIAKDVDGFHPYNVGCLAQGQVGDFSPWERHYDDRDTMNCLNVDGVGVGVGQQPQMQQQQMQLPVVGTIGCTPLAVVELLDRYNIPVSGKHAVVFGRGNIAGLPISLLLMRRKANVTNMYPAAPNAREVCRNADIVVAAMGCPQVITGDWIKPGAAVIDVGINFVVRHPGEAGSPTAMAEGEAVRRELVGDVDFESVKKKAAFASPVPGGVGPLTVTMLMRNTLKHAIAAIETGVEAPRR